MVERRQHPGLQPNSVYQFYFSRMTLVRTFYLFSVLLVLLGFSLLGLMQGVLPAQAQLPGAGGIVCDIFTELDENGLPPEGCEDVTLPPTDVCPNEETDPGVQTTTPCNADDLCPNDEGIQISTPCASDDVCPNDDGIQTETPCPSDEEENDPGSGSGGGDTNTGGGGGGGMSFSSESTATTTATTTNVGEVLGTTTEPIAEEQTAPASCTPYLSSYLRMGANNDKEEVKKLQTFLNTRSGATLPITGLFGPMTFEAVKKFQLDNAQNVLAPWVPFGLPSEHTATGYVYKTTQHQINKMMCAEFDVPAPQLP